jgi:hypothetical protein
MRGRSGLASGKLDLAGFGSAPASGGPPRRFDRAEIFAFAGDDDDAMADSNDPGPGDKECARVGSLERRCTAQTRKAGGAGCLSIVEPRDSISAPQQQSDALIQLNPIAICRGANSEFNFVNS